MNIYMHALLLLFFLWSGCCLFDTFPISILNFIATLLNEKTGSCKAVKLNDWHNVADTIAYLLNLGTY